MAIRPRLGFAGFNHIVNRVVARNSVYKSSIDKDKFWVKAGFRVATSLYFPENI